MLVLRRKPGESLVLGNRVRVTVLETRGDTVKLGIEAPEDVSIHRAELLESIEATNREATAGEAPAGLPGPLRAPQPPPARPHAIRVRRKEP